MTGPSEPKTLPPVSRTTAVRMVISVLIVGAAVLFSDGCTSHSSRRATAVTSSATSRPAVSAAPPSPSPSPSRFAYLPFTSAAQITKSRARAYAALFADVKARGSILQALPPPTHNIMKGETLVTPAGFASVTYAVGVNSVRVGTQFYSPAEYLSSVAEDTGTGFTGGCSGPRAPYIHCVHRRLARGATVWVVAIPFHSSDKVVPPNTADTPVSGRLLWLVNADGSSVYVFAQGTFGHGEVVTTPPDTSPPEGPSTDQLVQLAQEVAAAWQGSAADLTVAPPPLPVRTVTVGPPMATAFAATSGRTG
ncbi:hypothetical protein acdb102_20600 [Acidothermaceae bacterium B102]|nr:hypothetical protein acdb102_20600 [Acidothermaceae bacterium B102]